MKAKTIYFQNCLGVFQGGGCRGAAFVGAYKEASLRKVSFSELVGTSAGAIVAAFIAAGASPEKLEEIMSRLKFADLLKEPVTMANYKSSLGEKFISSFKGEINKVVKHAGLHSSDTLFKWVDQELKQLLNKLESVQFADLVIPISIVVTDLQFKKIRLFGNNHDDTICVAEAVRRSCNIPLFFQPIEKRFIDGGVLSNLASFVFKEQQETSYEKVLAFALIGNDSNEAEFNDLKSYMSLLASTIIDGSVDTQMNLQKNVHIIKIPTGNVKATDFKTITPEDTKYLLEKGQEITARFFDNELSNIHSDYRRGDINYDASKAYNEIAIFSALPLKEVIFSDYDTEWVYDLFPTIAIWITKKATVTILIKKNNDNPRHGPYRQKLLSSLGCEVIELDELPMRGMIINGSESDIARAIVYNETKDFKGYHSKSYFGDEDFKVITLLRDRCLSHAALVSKKIDLVAQSISNNLLFDRLKSVWQYNEQNVIFEVREVAIEELTFITRYILGFKYRQITELFRLFDINNLETFVPAQLNMPENKKSLITPPIIEEIGNQLIVVEGNTRLTYAYKNGIKRIKVVVVHGVVQPLPSTGRFSAHQILISDKTIKGEDRYENWNYYHFRKIESAVRNPENAVTEDL
jgi:predicted acylesterase/phospholipase RssA